MKDGAPHALNQNEKLPGKVSLRAVPLDNGVLSFWVVFYSFVLPMLFLWEFPFICCSFSKCLITPSQFTITFWSYKTKHITGVFGSDYNLTQMNCECKLFLICAWCYRQAVYSGLHGRHDASADTIKVDNLGRRERGAIQTTFIWDWFTGFSTRNKVLEWFMCRCQHKCLVCITSGTGIKPWQDCDVSLRLTVQVESLLETT